MARLTNEIVVKIRPQDAQLIREMVEAMNRLSDLLEEKANEHAQTGRIPGETS